MRARGRAVRSCVPILSIVLAVAVVAVAHAAIAAQGQPAEPLETIGGEPPNAPFSLPATSPPPVTQPPAPTEEPAVEATAVPAASAAEASAAARIEVPPPVIRNNQIIVYYGSPLAAGLGILGAMPAEEAAHQVAARASVYDGLNGDVGAVGALDVIYSLAQGEPTQNGMYVRHLEDYYVEEYLRIAEEHDLQLFLDLQIGRAQVLDEVRNIERFLLNPRVHVAIDPEYAVGPSGVPMATPGRISADEINAVQTYLRELVEAHGLPGKIVVVHQYMEDTVVDAERVETVADIDFVLNMDGLGAIDDKLKKYQHFSSRPHSKHDAFNVFFIHDQRVLSEEEILGMSPTPRIVFYQ
jgi:hypothetical protein